jgi:uncharacterized membrane protein
VDHHLVELHKEQEDVDVEDKIIKYKEKEVKMEQETTNNTPKKKSNILPILIVILAIVAIVIIVKPRISGDVTSSGSNAKTIEIALSQVSEQAKFYEYEGIEYFIVKASNGDIKTAFNACDICYTSKKGYRQEGNDMVCNNCGNHYAISGLGTENLKGGGCWPGYLPSEVQGDNIVIKISDLEKGRYRF